MTNDKDKSPPLRERFAFLGNPGSSHSVALQSVMFDVEERPTGEERILKLWRKTGAPVDEDLRQLWLHEMRQVQRVMCYAGAHDVIVDILEFVEDIEHFGVLLERNGEPLSVKTAKVTYQHWLKNLSAVRSRVLFWRNIRRVAGALGIVHGQGLVHGNLTADVIMTEASDEPDFQLGGFEWSLWLHDETGEQARARVRSTSGLSAPASVYSFAEDWRALGYLVAGYFSVIVEESGEIKPQDKVGIPISLIVSERVLLKRLIMQVRLDVLDAESIARAIDDIVANLSRSVPGRAGSLILEFDRKSVSGAVYNATNGEIASDEYSQQLQWIRADLAGGVAMFVPSQFDPATGRITLVTNAMVYRVRATISKQGIAVWDIAKVSSAEPRGGVLNVRDHDEHLLVHRIEVCSSPREAQETRARLGADVLDWSAFASPSDGDLADRHMLVRNALTLVQIVEALIKTLESYPVEVVSEERVSGQRYVTLCARPNNERDRFAKRIGLLETAPALKRLFEEDHRDAATKWRLSPSMRLGAGRVEDVGANFVEISDRDGQRGYVFEIDDVIPDGGKLFLRPQQDTGTERVISRRLRNIKALDTRIDLTEMLDDPWQVRRNSREVLDETDAFFADLDEPKRKALRALTSTLPAFLVVGPPGVGKTKLATETVRRRFALDKSTRILLSAQGHDALDNLQLKVRETLRENGMNDVIVVRTTAERRENGDEDVQRAVGEYLNRLCESQLVKSAPASLRDRVRLLEHAAHRAEAMSDKVAKDERAGLRALSNLVLDGANIVISTANSPDIERMVEAREQFDWVIFEEAAKAIGPELIGPLMLSGRRLLIGDHRQLPPFDVDRLTKILADADLAEQAMVLAESLVGPVLWDGDFEQMFAVAKDAEKFGETLRAAIRLLEPFRTFVEDDERRSFGNPTHRSISETLTEQRRMHPAIATIVSETFYDKKLRTEAGRAAAALTEPPPFIHLGAMSRSPIIVVDFEHVSATGQRRSLEKGRPRWHNPSEAESVVDVLRHVRAREGCRPTLAILSPYKAQVDKLDSRVKALRSGALKHLDGFVPVRDAFVGTVDSFQGSEADLVIVSLVRNNERTGGGALGFLRNPQRMNVLLSRAKHQLVFVGSLQFLKEAVRGVNPDREAHELGFLSTMCDTIQRLTREAGKDGAPLAVLVGPSALKGAP